MNSKAKCAILVLFILIVGTQVQLSINDSSGFEDMDGPIGQLHLVK
jgi:hypothetical protein